MIHEVIVEKTHMGCCSDFERGSSKFPTSNNVCILSSILIFVFILFCLDCKYMVLANASVGNLLDPSQNHYIYIIMLLWISPPDDTYKMAICTSGLDKQGMEEL